MADSNFQAISIIDTLDEHGGTIREINAVSLETDTVKPETLLVGTTAHDAKGNAIVGTMPVGGKTMAKEQTIAGSLTHPQKIIASLSTVGSASITGTISKIPVKEVEYLGPYAIDPTFEDQTLNTNQKIMTDDVTVKAIAVSRTSNTSGGITVYIGGLE